MERANRHTILLEVDAMLKRIGGSNPSLRVC